MCMHILITSVKEIRNISTLSYNDKIFFSFVANSEGMLKNLCEGELLKNRWYVEHKENFHGY